MFRSDRAGHTGIPLIHLLAYPHTAQPCGPAIPGIPCLARAHVRVRSQPTSPCVYPDRCDRYGRHGNPLIQQTFLVAHLARLGVTGVAALVGVRCRAPWRAGPFWSKPNAGTLTRGNPLGIGVTVWFAWGSIGGFRFGVLA
jgi:hypothetical protein